MQSQTVAARVSCTLYIIVLMPSRSARSLPLEQTVMQPLRSILIAAAGRLIHSLPVIIIIIIIYMQFEILLSEREIKLTIS